MEVNKIICGDALEVLPTLPKAKMIFADPPDNLGIKYNGFNDNFGKQSSYITWLDRVIRTAQNRCEILWLSYFYKYDIPLIKMLHTKCSWDCRKFIWRFTFGQHNKYDCGNGYRPIMRMKSMHAILYPQAIKVPSARQTKYNDKRYKKGGRVPDDVFEFSRVCGTFKERRKWHPCQHPEALIERIVKFSCKPGDLVIDMFAGSGTVNRVCKRLNIDCIGIELSKFYCEKIAEETGAEYTENEK